MINAEKKERFSLCLVLFYFAGFAFLMSYLGGQPDQGLHQPLSLRFMETWGIPIEDTSFNVISRTPYLTYWINGAVGKLYLFFFPGKNSVTELIRLWRFISIITSVITLFFLYKLTKRLTKNGFLGVIAAFCLGNTIMFVFVSSGISYDNLMNLSSIASIYYLVKIYQNEDFVLNSIILGIWLALGPLAKEQALLLTFLIFLAYIYFVSRNFRKINLKFSRRYVLPTIMLLFLLVLLLLLYGKNVLIYGKLVPECSQLKAADLCTRFMYRREQYQPKSIGWYWTSIHSLNNPFQYFFSFWFLQMIQSIWGIISHNTYVSMAFTSLHGYLLIWSFIVSICYWDRKEVIQNILLKILLAYTLFIFLMNYKTWVDYDFRHYAVQGRYLFPVIGILISMTLNNFMKINNLLIKKVTLSIMIIVYFLSGGGLFWLKYGGVFANWKIF